MALAGCLLQPMNLRGLCHDRGLQNTCCCIYVFVNAKIFIGNLFPLCPLRGREELHPALDKAFEPQIHPPNAVHSAPGHPKLSAQGPDRHRGVVLNIGIDGCLRGLRTDPMLLTGARPPQKAPSLFIETLHLVYGAPVNAETVGNTLGIVALLKACDHPLAQLLHLFQVLL